MPVSLRVAAADALRWQRFTSEKTRGGLFGPPPIRRGGIFGTPLASPRGLALHPLVCAEGVTPDFQHCDTLRDQSKLMYTGRFLKGGVESWRSSKFEFMLTFLSRLSLVQYSGHSLRSGSVWGGGSKNPENRNVCAH